MASTRNGRFYRPKKDPETKHVENVLRGHFPECPLEFPPSAYRYNPASIRVRVVSPRFHGLSLAERDDLVYPILENSLPEKTWSDIMLILLLAPEEVSESAGNYEFEHPAPARV